MSHDKKLASVRITTMDDALAGLYQSQRRDEAVAAIFEELDRAYAASGKAIVEQIMADWPELAEEIGTHTANNVPRVFPGR